MDIVKGLRGEYLNCNCFASSSNECCCDDAGWPEDYCRAAAEEIEQLRKIEAVAREVVKYKCASGAFVALKEVLDGHR
jgi:hypothetical protein